MASAILVALASVSLLLFGCQPAATSGAPTEAVLIGETVALPPTVAQSVTSVSTLPAASAVGPEAGDTSEDASTAVAEQATSVPPTSVPSATPAAELSPAPEDSADTAHILRPIEEISAGGPPQIEDITDGDAVLVFESSIPLACSIVYGKTPAYGLISLDQDMAGGAHTDHRPLLLGLEPDTEYHYRVQGSAADGTLYISEDMTFRTLPAAEEAEVNLASLEAGARIAAVSSSFGGAGNEEPWGANSAIDGSRGTAWSSDGDGNDAYIEIELAQPARLYAIEVWTRSMGDGTAQISTFTLTTDGVEVWGPFTLADAEQAYRFEIDAAARSLRLDVVDSSGGNTGLIEFAAYGTPVDN